MHVGVYAKCDFEKVKTTTKVYGCPEHASFNDTNWRKFCAFCGKEMVFFEKEELVYPVEDYDQRFYPLEKRVVDNKMYMVATDYQDGTTFDYEDELRIDFSLMVDALMKFNNLYKEQIYNLSKFGKVEVHFGILND